jgi:hypothetical protein
VDLVLLPQGGKTGVVDRRRPLQAALPDARRRDRGVVAGGEKVTGQRVTVEETGSLTAAVKAEGERVEPAARTGQQGTGATPSVQMMPRCVSTFRSAASGPKPAWTMPTTPPSAVARIRPDGSKYGLAKVRYSRRMVPRSSASPRPVKAWFQTSATAGGSVLRKRRY